MPKYSAQLKLQPATMSKRTKSAPVPAPPVVDSEGKMETTYQWKCSQCGIDNRVTDALICSQCGKLRTDERCLRHFKSTIGTGHYGHRGPGKGYTQRDGTERQRDTENRHAEIVKEVRTALERRKTEAVAKRSAARQLRVSIKTVRKVWRTHCKDHPEDAAQI
jgi:hypothetical protein